MNFLIPNLVDIIDIIIVSFIIYKIILVIKETTGLTVLIGVATFIVVYFLALILDMKLILSIISFFKEFWLIILVILFQKEIRQFMSKIVNQNYNVFNLNSKTDFQKIKLITNAIESMAFRKIGALIIFEGKNSLDELIEKKGELIDAAISTKLIMTVFNNKTILHDGALIIRKNRIHAVKVILPLTQKPEFNQQYGTRHLSAIGVTEKYDAYAVVVSEESGKISVAKNGQLTVGVSKEELPQRINDETR